jgi:hypothetical protein
MRLIAALLAAALLAVLPYTDDQPYSAVAAPITTFVWHQDTFGEDNGFLTNITASLTIRGGFDDLPTPDYISSPKPYDFGNLLALDFQSWPGFFTLADFAAATPETGNSFTEWWISPSGISFVSIFTSFNMIFIGATFYSTPMRWSFATTTSPATGWPSPTIMCQSRAASA